VSDNRCADRGREAVISEKKKRIVFVSSLAGFFIALFWIVLLTIPFLPWPRAQIIAAQISVPALWVHWGGASGISGSAILLVFLFVSLSNAAVYGLTAFVILAFTRNSRS
jgi:hypothetical protein